MSNGNKPLMFCCFGLKYWCTLCLQPFTSTFSEAGPYDYRSLLSTHGVAYEKKSRNEKKKNKKANIYTVRKSGPYYRPPHQFRMNNTILQPHQQSMLQLMDPFGHLVMSQRADSSALHALNECVQRFCSTFFCGSAFNT